MEKFKKHSNAFTYLVERWAAACYCIIPKLKDSLVEDLIKDTLDGSRQQNIRVCVVLGPTRAIFVEPDGSSKESDSIPASGTILDKAKYNSNLFTHVD